jgi:DNA-binding MarR family transcriptional regulator
VSTASDALRDLMRLRPTQARLVEILVSSDRPLSGREFARRLGIAPTTAIAALSRLEKAGVVTREAAGKAHLWRLDDTEEYIREWRAEHAAARRARLADLIERHYWTPFGKVLYCAQDVWDGILLDWPARKARQPPEPDGHALMAIEVHVAEHYEPGQWKMIRHDRCQVTGGETPEQAVLVTHEECTVLGRSDEP